MSDEYENFLQYLNLSDSLIEQSSKDLIAETPRALALMVAHYQANFGEMPMEESLRLLRKERRPDPLAARWFDLHSSMHE